MQKITHTQDIPSQLIRELWFVCPAHRFHDNWRKLYESNFVRLRTRVEPLWLVLVHKSLKEPIEWLLKVLTEHIEFS